MQDRTDSNAVIDGFTIRNGVFGEGGAIYLRSSDPIIRNCVFVNNRGLISGGTLRCKSSDPIFRNCTFVGSRSPVGGFMYCIAGAKPMFENCIVAYGTEGGTVGLAGSTDSAYFFCTNLFGNVGGDWNDRIDHQLGLEGNMTANPEFCDIATDDFSLQATSPCLPANNSCGELIGSLTDSTCNAGG
jgi:hypothetical protein